MFFYWHSHSSVKLAMRISPKRYVMYVCMYVCRYPFRAAFRKPKRVCYNACLLSQGCCSLNEDTIVFFLWAMTLSWLTLPPAACCFQKHDTHSGCRFCEFLVACFEQLIIFSGGADEVNGGVMTASHCHCHSIRKVMDGLILCECCNVMTILIWFDHNWHHAYLRIVVVKFSL